MAPAAPEHAADAVQPDARSLHFMPCWCALAHFPFTSVLPAFRLPLVPSPVPCQCLHVLPVSPACATRIPCPVLFPCCSRSTVERPNWPSHATECNELQILQPLPGTSAAADQSIPRFKVAQPAAVLNPVRWIQSAPPSTSTGYFRWYAVLHLLEVQVKPGAARTWGAPRAPMQWPSTDC